MRKIYLLSIILFVSCGNNQNGQEHTSFTTTQEERQMPTPSSKAESYAQTTQSNKPNDWFVAIYFNPAADYGDFSAQGLTKNNTEFLSAGDYWGNAKVQGYFNNNYQKFLTFYNNASIAWNYYITGDTEGRHIVQYAYGSMDSFAPSNAIKGNAYERNYVHSNYPDRLRWKEIAQQSNSYSDLEDEIEELKEEVERLRNQ